jgi:hypothetical protein
MRIGQNPSKAKGSPAYKPARVGIATLTYIPALEGYFREALDVINVHLASLRASLDQDCDLHVFDNGSCPEVVDYLEDQWRAGLIDWLSLSHHNLGKNGALNWIFAAMPNEFIAYSDSDVFYRKGWLEASLKIFDSFKCAGMVSAQPVFFDFLRGQGTTAEQIDAAGDGLSVTTIKPRSEIVEEYCDGINASEDLRRKFREQELQVAVNETVGERAVTTATDMQFMLSKEVASKLVPLPIAGALTARDAIDIPLGIEQLGYWLLSTIEPLVWHMGNSLTGGQIPEVDQLRDHLHPKQPEEPAPAQRSDFKSKMKSSLSKTIRRSPRIKRNVERMYGGLFSLLYEEQDDLPSNDNHQQD